MTVWKNIDEDYQENSAAIAAGAVEHINFTNSRFKRNFNELWCWNNSDHDIKLRLNGNATDRIIPVRAGDVGGFTKSEGKRVDFVVIYNNGAGEIAANEIAIRAENYELVHP